MIGVADQVAPADNRHALWLVNYPPHTPLLTAVGVAQEFTTNGLSAGRPVLLPAGYQLVRGTKRGLLLAPVQPIADGRTVRLWNPVTGRFTAAFNAVVAASADAVAYIAPRCPSTCPVHVLNLVTGYKLALRVPSGHVVTDAQFSPDGRYLALEVSAGESSDSSTLEVQLEVASLASGHLTVLPHTWATGDPMTGLGWPGNDDRLVVKLNTGSEVQMAFWAPGHRSLAIAFVKGDENPADISWIAERVTAMEDIIGRGDDDRPPPSRLRRVAVVVTVAAVAALVVAEHLPHGTTARASSRRRAALVRHRPAPGTGPGFPR